MLKKYLQAGKIVGTHGVKGEIKVQPWCDSSEFLMQFKTLYFDGGKNAVKILTSRVHKNLLLLTIEGVNTVEAADMLRDKILYIDREKVKLPKGRYFMQDLLKIDVFDADSFIYYGTLTDVIQTGANDVYQITSQKHKNYLIPAIPSVIQNIDFEKNKMLIRPIKGIFDDDED